MLIDAKSADITKMEGFDAVVNSANHFLSDSSPHSINHAIFIAAGPNLVTSLAAQGSCNEGEAVLTPGFNLPNSYIIHTVVPKWEKDNPAISKALAKCYTSCFEQALAHKLRSLAFPSLGTGNCKYPATIAAETAVSALVAFLQKNPNALDSVVWCLPNAKSVSYYKAAIDALVPAELRTTTIVSIQNTGNKKANVINDKATVSGVQSTTLSTSSTSGSSSSSESRLFNFCNRYRLLLTLIARDPELNKWCREYHPAMPDTNHEALRDLLQYRMTNDARHAAFMTGKCHNILSKNDLIPEKLPFLTTAELNVLPLEVLSAVLELLFTEDETEEGKLIRESVSCGILLRVIDVIYSKLY